MSAVAARLGDEPARLAALRRYEVLDTSSEPAFDEITAIVRAVFNAPMVAITLIDADRLWFKSRHGIAPEAAPREIAFCNHTIEGATCLAVADAARDPRFADNPLVTGPMEVKSYLGAPLTTPEGYNVGSICVLDTSPRVYSASEEALLRQFAGLVVAQFELRQIVCRDCLTGALTRRAFEEAANRELARHARGGAPAVLGVFDLDHFKRVNDLHGHSAGDAVLQATVAACAEAMRDTDSLGRIGGEEFGVLIAGATAEEGMRALERMRVTIAATRVPGLPDLGFTASFGAAVCGPDVADARGWFAAADAALYAAKRAGRNRCLLAAAPEAAAIAFPGGRIAGGSSR